ncbi:NAD(P)-binding domain-containing protein [Nisaea acidiphila]|uniref:NAD(P)-binding domain-containing protein n=1 Tax=Nisaea acidiphila TaxID=1862145 RepID=A0A9J7ARW8_9PROT|nr:NAD(P)-binding domain-containing protein [Nisaea acidiphila]UUX49958.1 NAD(P)-binding domain-containing protein [Nisaea acidiphila]
MNSVGIIGVGYLGACLAEGLASAGLSVLLSPRNAARSAELAERFGCRIASGNAEVIERSEVVFLSTRPAQIAETASGLPWRADQVVISTAAGIGLDTIRPAVAPATAVRSMPIATSRLRRSPTAFYPENPTAAEVLRKLGTAIPFEDEGAFETASIFGAYYAMLYAFFDEMSGWAEMHGLPPEPARLLTAGMADAAAAAVIDRTDVAPRQLLDDLLTPGGISEEGLKVLRDAGALSRWRDAMDASLERALAIKAVG